MTAIQLQHVSKTYGDVTALDGIDLEVEPGEVVAILGPNGAGKTTALELLLGIRRPSTGRVRVFGADPERRATRQRVGAMLQDAGWPPSNTVGELVDVVGRTYPRRLPLDDTLSRADLAPQRGTRVSQLSGGQRQRLSFALAIAGDPDLLFLDEPTVALDVEARRGFWDQTRALADRGRTVLFSTHYLAEADAVADRVVLLRAGTVLADAPPSELKRLVAAKTIRMATDLPLAELRALPEVESVEASGADGPLAPGLQRVVVRSNAPERVLASLVLGERVIAGLTVADTDLETAFRHLTAA